MDNLTNPRESKQNRRRRSFPNPMHNPAILLVCTAMALLSQAPAMGAESAPPPGPKAAELAAFAASTEKEVTGDILPFWMKYTRNAENGGYYGIITADMTVRKGANRGALLTSRILWTFSTAYRTYHDPAYLEMARWAYRDLMDHFRDPESGGLYWTITADGKPLDARKQIYGQAFGIYALAEYYRASGEKAALDEAIAIYLLVEQHARDRLHGGYFDALDRKWNRPTFGEHNLLGDAPKSQNSHIHILEAYTELLRVWPDAGLLANQRDLIEMTLVHVIDPKTHHLILFMKDDWTPIGEEISYGHDIELSWLIVEAAKGVGDPALIARVKPVSLDIARVTLAEGVDPDGGVISEGSPHGYTNTNKEWWEQAEAVVGFLNAYQLSGDARYLDASRHSWAFIQAKFIDRVHGDWINLVKRDGTPYPLPKVSLWKCPYHSGRSCFEVAERVRELGAASP
jgi:mannobiose 2-epimerase